MKLNMSVEDNFSSYIDEEAGFAIFVDSFDNSEFEVKMGGGVDEAISMGTLTAGSDEELNRKLIELIEKYKEKNT